MISSTSRYANSSVVTIENAAGNHVQVIVPGEQESFTFSYVYHVVAAQDRIDLVADAYYNDPLQWWRIGDANPEILDWSAMPVGTQIRVPNA